MYATCGLKCTECGIGNCGVSDLPVEELERLSGMKRTLTFKKGETIFHMGDTANHFYSISSGSVQLFRSSPYREQSFGIISSGDWMGFRDALAGEGYQHNARALCNTSVCKFERSVLIELMAKYPSFAASIAQELAHGWSESENQSYNLGARKVVERMADFLLKMKEHDCPATMDSEEAPEIEFPLTREVVATLMGTTTESVIRTLSDFKSRGWIKMKKGKIAFTDESELSRLVMES